MLSGIGRAILLTALLKMQQIGYAIARIDSVSGNNASNVLYESVGFEQDEETVQYFRWF
ncbi:MAG: hypothetical protein IPK19_29980 [Chloroflexi bacterium]|nr:hypothetical protein [Chloroflexota bacterium]